MNTTTTEKTYDLELRTKSFAIECRKFIRKIKKDTCNFEDSKQLARSSGSIGANYIEAVESFSKKDYLFRVKVCRKEAKETVYWLDLLLVENIELEKEKELLRKEALELMKIFGSIVTKLNKFQG